MEFLGFNGSEFLLWLAIALLVFGPGHARELARYYMRGRKLLAQVRGAWEDRVEALAREGEAQVDGLLGEQGAGLFSSARGRDTLRPEARGRALSAESLGSWSRDGEETVSVSSAVRSDPGQTWEYSFSHRPPREGEAGPLATAPSSPSISAPAGAKAQEAGSEAESGETAEAGRG